MIHFKNIASRLRYNIRQLPFKNIIAQKENNDWIWYTYNDLNNKINYCINVLKKNNINYGDNVVYKGKNSIDWIAWNMATYSIGAVWVPLYHNQNHEYIQHVLDDSYPKMFITDDYKNSKKYSSLIDANYKLNICKNKIPDITLSFKDKIFSVKEYEISNLIYTSGTSSAPKGVILTHNNLLSNLNMVEKNFFSLQEKYNCLTTLNILPWAHIYSLNTELYYNLLNNNCIALCDHPNNLLEDIKKIQPNTLYFVPRILENIKQKVDFLDKPFINKILPYILGKIFGNKLLIIFTGGAYLSPITKKFYIDNGIKIIEGYGATETSPMISVHNLDSYQNIESIGKILDNVVVEIIDNEICVHGKNVMKGYWNNKKETEKVFFEKNNMRFYKTGDSGYIKDNFLYYKGRINTNYKLSNGKFVNVEEVENNIKKHTNKNLLVYGENRDYNILIMEHDLVINKIDFLKKINDSLNNKYLKIKDILFIDNKLFIDNMTPKMSIKRKEVYRSLKHKINILYLSHKK
jgi:long-chain acyl-CoA synthetase